MSTDYHILEIIARLFAKLFPFFGKYFLARGRNRRILSAFVVRTRKRTAEFAKKEKEVPFCTSFTR